MTIFTDEQIDVLSKFLSVEQVLKLRAVVIAEEKPKWEPKGGDWYIDFNGTACPGVSSCLCRLAGNEFQSKEQAERMAVHEQRWKWIRAYILEKEPDWNGGGKWFVYRDGGGNWDKDSAGGKLAYPDMLAASESTMQSLADDLNSGYVVLPGME